MKNKTLTASNIRLFMLSSLCSLFLISCSQRQDEKKEVPVVEVNEPTPVEAPSEEEQLYEQVMEIHDHSMAKMSQIRKLSLQLADSIENTRVNPMEQEETINLYRNRLKDLKEADVAMRQWMRRFDAEAVPAEQKVAYLQEEQQKIQKVDRQMDEAIANAREALRQ